MQLRCVFLQFSDRYGDRATYDNVLQFRIHSYSGESSWSSEGVSTEILESGRVRCVAKHLTSFTVLLSPTGAEAVSGETIMDSMCMHACMLCYRTILCFKS